MVQQRRNNKKTPRFSSPKSFETSLIKSLSIKRLFILCGFFLTQCSTTSPVSHQQMPQTIKDSDGTIFQLTFIGENQSPSYSKAHNKIVYSKKLNTDLWQIYELDISTNTEKRITYNLGDNIHPSIHPFRLWLSYSSSKDEQVEKISIQKLMKEYGLSESPLMNHELGYEVYVSAMDGSDSQRLTQSRGYDGLSTFSGDGTKIYFMKHSDSSYEIIESDASKKSLKKIWSQKKPIVSFSIQGSTLAVVSKVNDQDYELNIFPTFNGGSPVFSFKTQKEIQSIHFNKNAKNVLMSAALDDDENLDIYEVDISKNCKKRITSHKEQDQSPIYGNNDNVIIFSSTRSGPSHIYTKSLETNLPCTAN